MKAIKFSNNVASILKVADLKLLPKDKKVIESFIDKKSAESKKLFTDGKKLDGLWMGGNNIANWSGDKIQLNETGGRAAQTIHRYIKKVGGFYVKVGKILGAKGKADEATMKKALKSVDLSKIADISTGDSKGRKYTLTFFNLKELGELIAEEAGLNYNSANGKSTMFSISLDEPSQE